MTDGGGVDASVDTAAVDSSKGDDSSKDFDRVMSCHPVSFLFFFEPIVFKKFPRYRLSCDQFNFQVNI